MVAAAVVAAVATGAVYGGAAMKDANNNNNNNAVVETQAKIPFLSSCGALLPPDFSTETGKLGKL